MSKAKKKCTPWWRLLPTAQCNTVGRGLAPAAFSCNFAALCYDKRKGGKDMKKQEKLDLIRFAIETPQLCRCYFTYDDNYYYYYPNAVNEKFLLGQEEDDFILDGYCIRKISHLKKVEIKDDLCNTINKFNGTHELIKMPPVDISSWQSIFTSLKALDCFIIIENEIEGKFLIGVVEKTLKNKLYFKSFDADGIWDDVGLEIPYSQITTVKWATRYADVWQNYLQQNS